MGLFSFLQRKKTPAPEARKRTPPPQDPVTVETLRTRARRRLIGAAVLVGGAVLGLPALFDKPPRPADQSFKVRLAGGEGAVATASAKAPTAAGQAASAASTMSAGAGLPSGSAVALATVGAVTAAAVLPGTARKPPADESIITEPKVDPKAEAMARAAADKLKADKARAEKLKAEKARQAEQAREAEKADKAREARLAAKKAKDARDAQDALESARKDKDARDAKAAKLAKAAEKKADKPAKADSESDKPRRYVIQAGSFAEATAARDLGRRIGKIGLDSHEQHVETAAGSARTRVRLGPFNSKEEALRAAAKLKAAGLNAAVLPL
jgi:DedD protein